MTAAHSYRWLLVRGIGAGAVAGVAAALVGLFLVEASIQDALAVEEARSGGGHHNEEIFSRGTQIAGGAAAAVIVGLALGAVFATAFTAAYRRLPGATAFGRAVALATVSFGVAGLLPALKYPANPPGVGDPDTVNDRTLAYLSLILAGVLVAYGMSRLAETLRARTDWPAAVRATLVAAATAAATVVVLIVWPANPDTVPADITASLLWRFRLASLAEILTLWAVLGLSFGLLVELTGRQRAGASGRPAATPPRSPDRV